MRSTGLYGRLADVVDSEQQQREPGLTDAMEDRNEAIFREGGRDFLLAFYAALRNLKLYPIENVQVQRALDEVASTARTLLDVEPELEVRIAGEFIFVNSTRLRLALDNYSTFSHILTTLRVCGVGAVHVEENVERREWQILLSLLLASAASESGGDGFDDLQKKLSEGGVRHIEL
jgi:hypothetical protein